MPIHDWTRVRANRFHDFHQSWTIRIRDALNTGRLPAGYFAMVDQRTGGPEPDVITLETPTPKEPDPGGGLAVEAAPPKVRFVTRKDSFRYAQKANRLVVYHPDGGVVSVIEIVSPGNKDSRNALRTFTRNTFAFLNAGIHLLIVDLFPSGKRDPQGIHKAIWDRVYDEPFTLPPDKPLTLAAYAAGTEWVAYVEPVAVGDRLPDMPVFFTADRYVPCPLEETYQQAWAVFPAPLKAPPETPPAT
jgi:Protein of unknown function (DUF4058)